MLAVQVRRRAVFVPALLITVFAVGVAAAQTDSEVTRAQPFEIRLSSLVVMIAVGVVIPIVSGLLTKVHAHPALKGGLTILLTAVAALLTQATVNDGVAVISKQMVVLWFVGLAQAEATYYAIWKPVNAPANLAPRFGLGPANPPAPPR